MNFRFAALAALSCLIFSAAALAAPVGVMSLTNCSGGGVTVTASSIDWLPAGGGSGCIVTSTGTNITFTGGGPLLPGVTGTILDLTFPGPSPINDFMMFTGNPNLHFNLLTLGPGASSIVCSTTLNPNNAACSVFAGSPVILTPTSTGTSVSLDAFGIATDSSAQTSSWKGAYTTQFPGIAPAQLQAAIMTGTTLPGFCSGGACTDSYSGSFAISTIPEPMSMFLIGSGLIGLALVKRWRK